MTANKNQIYEEEGESAIGMGEVVSSEKCFGIDWTCCVLAHRQRFTLLKQWAEDCELKAIHPETYDTRFEMDITASIAEQLKTNFLSQ